jgi:hypothetical protein
VVELRALTKQRSGLHFHTFKQDLLMLPIRLELSYSRTADA